MGGGWGTSWNDVPCNGQEEEWSYYYCLCALNTTLYDESTLCWHAGYEPWMAALGFFLGFCFFMWFGCCCVRPPYGVKEDPHGGGKCIAILIWCVVAAVLFHVVLAPAAGYHPLVYNLGGAGDAAGIAFAIGYRIWANKRIEAEERANPAAVQPLPRQEHAAPEVHHATLVNDPTFEPVQGTVPPAPSNHPDDTGYSSLSITSPAEEPSPQRSLTDKLRDLQEARDSGLLTQSEFEDAKKATLRDHVFQ